MTSTLGIKKIQYPNGTNSITIDSSGSAAITTANITTAAITTANITNAIATGTITTPSINGGQIGGRRNIVINGAMQVAQRNTSVTGLGASYGYFTVDRFQHNHNGNSAGRYTSSQTASGLDGFANCLKLDCTTADTSIGATERFFIAYQMEGQDIQHFKKGTSSAKDFVVSFYAKANGNFTYVCGFYDANNNRTVSRTFSVTSNWQRFTINFGADTTGVFSNNNALALQLRWYLHVGSNYTGGTLQTVWDAVTNNETAGGMTSSFFSSTDNEFFLTGVQLEVGGENDGTSIATPFEHRSFGEEIALCQRYYYQSKYGAAITSGDLSFGPAPSPIYHSFTTEMRVDPTVTTKTDVDTGSGRYVVVGVGNYTNGDYIQAIKNRFTMRAPAALSHTSNRCSCGLIADAEL